MLIIGKRGKIKLSLVIGKITIRYKILRIRITRISPGYWIWDRIRIQGGLFGDRRKK
jgi:hypothetical protein